MADGYGYYGIALGHSIDTSSAYLTGTGFDVTKYKTLYIDAKAQISSRNGKIGISPVGTSYRTDLSGKGSYSSNIRFTKAVSVAATRSVLSIDVSNLSGQYFIVALSPIDTSSMYIYNIWLE